MTPLDLPVSHPPLYHSHLIRNKSTDQRGAWPVQGKLEEPGPRVARSRRQFSNRPPGGGRIKSKTAPSIRLRNEESSPTGRGGSAASTISGSASRHWACVLPSPAIWRTTLTDCSCIIGSAYDAYRFDGAQIRIAEVYQSTARTGPQGSMSDVFRVSTCSGEVVGSAVGGTC